MKKSWLIKLTALALTASLAFCFAACGKNEEKNAADTSNSEATNSETEVEQDFIVVGTDEDGKTPLIFYNLNMVSSVEELEEYVDLSYDFDEKPELLLAQYEAPEGVFEQIMEMLDEKGVVYTIIEE